HMFTPWHRDDIRKVGDEDGVMAALRPFGLAPGDYAVPMAGSMDAMKSPEFLAKMNEGPVVFMTVRPSGAVGMGKNLAVWFAYSVVVSLFAAYVASRALAPAAHYLAVFRFAGVTALAGYALALAQNSIWWGRNWAMTLRSMADGLLYALLTAGVFGWLWPH
ncbi:MAG TPA: hypothetical protein VFV33_21900, partial [Gemmatimonadaceae bacterium]|nr:hypothetical protein [Gemmatimonadaceae bacterium]